MTDRTVNAKLASILIRQPARAALTLIELMIAITLIAILTAIIIPQFSSGAHDQLKSVASILSADLAYGRNLAVTNDSKYRFLFDTTENRYVLQHSGSNSLLDALPPSSLKRPDDTSDQQTTDLDDLPHIGPTVNIVGVYRMTNSPTAVTYLEFGPLGETARTEPTVIWLGWGSGVERRYMSVRVDPITGLASIQELQSAAPP